MKILVLLPDSPDPWTNTAARYYGPMLKTLATLGEEVTVLAIRRGANDAAELAYFRGTNIRIRLFDPPPARPFLERKLRSLWRSGWELVVSELGRTAHQEARGDYDVILGEMPETARILENDPRMILSLHHFRFQDLSPTDGGESVREKIERMQAKRAELSTCRRVAMIRTTSRRLAVCSRQLGVNAPIKVVPICIDPTLYHPLPAPLLATVGVLGSMFWPPSRRAAQHFLTRIVPRIRAQQPGVRFVVGGWQARRFLSTSVASDDIELLDNFASPADAFAKLSVLVYAPPIGTGMKVKVLEAMGYGVPTVVNGEGFEGLDADPDPAACLASSDDEIVDHVLRILRDPEVRQRTASMGRRCIERSFSPEVVTRALLELFRKREGDRAL